MSVSKRITKNGTVSWRVRWRDQGYQREKHFKSLKDAKLFDAQVQADQQNRKLLTARITLQELIEEYRQVRMINFRTNTIETYEKSFRIRILDPQIGIGSILVADLNRKTIEAWRAKLVKRGDGLVSINNAVGTLRTVLNFAIEWEYCESNPATKLKELKTKPRTTRAYTLKQIYDISEIIKVPRNKTLLRLGALTGLRIGEMLALTWDDIGKDTISVSKSLNPFREVSAPKSNANRVVPMFDATIELLKQYQLESPPISNIVFSTHRGEYCAYSMISKQWRQIRLEYTGHKYCENPKCLCDARLHDLRHSFASLAISANATPLQVKSWLGHSSIKMTYDRYGHLFEAEKDSSIEAVNRLINNLEI